MLVAGGDSLVSIISLLSSSVDPFCGNAPEHLPNDVIIRLQPNVLPLRR